MDVIKVLEDLEFEYTEDSNKLKKVLEDSGNIMVITISPNMLSFEFEWKDDTSFYARALQITYRVVEKELEHRDISLKEYVERTIKSLSDVGSIPTEKLNLFRVRYV